MTPIVLLCIIIAAVLVLHACATSIADSEELHELAVRVHTVRNEYLANLRGISIGEVEVIEDEDASGTAGRIEPATDDAAQPAQAAA
ncbi:MAG: hypothetical protein AAFS11_03885 [Planctomycetota bacterium]